MSVMIRLVNLLFLIILAGILIYVFKSYYKKYEEFNTNTQGIIGNDSLILAKNSGRNVLPLNVQLALHVLDSLHAKNYNIYGTFRYAQGEFYQRIQESSWPMRFDTNSRVLIGYPDEIKSLPNVKVIFRNDNICLGIR